MGLILSTMAFLSKSLATVTGASFLVLALASPRSRRARFYLNALLYVGSLGVCSVWGVVVSVILSLVPRQRLNINKVVARSFYLLAGGLTGIQFDVEGEQHFATSPAVLVGNHQTSIDILYLGRIFPGYASIMAKQELKFAPLLGQYMLLSGAVFINRKNRHDSIKAFAQVGADMKRRNLSLWVFPEGTRSNLPFPDLLPFKKGAFHLAVQAGVPVIPVVCENYHRLFDGKTRFESGRVRIKVLPPIPTAHLTADDVNELTTTVRQKMLDELKAMDAQRQLQDTAAQAAATAAAAAAGGAPAPRRPGGLAGLVSYLVGTGSAQAHDARLARHVEREEQQLRQPGTSGTAAQDYGLVTESQKPSMQATASSSTTSALDQHEADEVKRRNIPSSAAAATQHANGSGSSVGETTDDDGNVVISRATSIS
ncbi:1-acylglycerol-3-phosphate O-acyltransferase [Thecaphora frezii]